MGRENSGGNFEEGGDACVIDLASCKEGGKASWTHAGKEMLPLLTQLLTEV